MSATNIRTWSLSTLWITGVGVRCSIVATLNVRHHTSRVDRLNSACNLTSMTQREFASLGGKARAKKLSKQERTDIARQAGLASARQRASKHRSCQSDGNTENKV